LQTFERYPKCIGVERDNCVAVLIPGVDGLASPGRSRLADGRSAGRANRKDGRQVFQAKSEIVEATPERLATLQRFRDDVAEVLRKSDAD